mgnify:FL=1
MDYSCKALLFKYSCHIREIIKNYTHFTHIPSNILFLIINFNIQKQLTLYVQAVIS